ncbi:MAG: pseudouridine synthase [Actinomycetota bacterium]|nr:MAG: pseudouridine synthase [Actinomycetota bacterium]
MPERLVARPGRLDAVLASLAGIPRTEAQRAIEEGRVRVDGVPRRRSHRLAGGERIEFDPAPAAGLVPEGPPVPVRFEDEHLIVVAKPAGVLTHPTPTRRRGALVNRLLAMGRPLAPAGGALRPGVVHRLDVGTSGLVVLAKTDEAHRALAALMRRHEADRRYLALVRGRVGPEAFAIDAPLGRRAARVVVDRVGGRAAATEVRVVERLPRATLLEAAPRTGRTHQIRVHLAAIGHPVLGDRAYGGGGDEARRVGLDRPFLHAWRLGFRHPITGARVELEEPLPDELASALERARDDQRP